MSKRIAVVTGANKGIGYAICRALIQTKQFLTILTARDEGKFCGYVEHQHYFASFEISNLVL
jgi:NAD(P)-dependent dehydrogenase (short-subunit alcohol dehydrogenase family)